MPAQRLTTGATSSDLLADEDIRDVTARSILDLSAASVTNGDQIGLRLGRTVILEDGELNIEASADVVDIDRDALIKNLVIGPGKLRMPVPTLTTELQAWLQVRRLG